MGSEPKQYKEGSSNQNGTHHPCGGQIDRQRSEGEGGRAATPNMLWMGDLFPVPSLALKQSLQARGMERLSCLTSSCNNPIGTWVSRLVPDKRSCGIPERGDTLQGHRGPHGRGILSLEGLIGFCNKARHSVVKGGYLGCGGMHRGSSNQ